MPTSYTGENPSPRYLLVGEILRPHGVRGELRMRVLTDYPERLKTLSEVFLSRKADDENPRSYTPTSVRFHQGYALVFFKGVADRDAADRLRGMLVMVDVANAVPLEEGEFYLYQLIGLNVVTESGEVLGKIAEVLETGANDVYIVQGGAHGEILIPVTPETILKTDIAAGQVTVRLPEGLLPERAPISANPPESSSQPDQP